MSQDNPTDDSPDHAVLSQDFLYVAHGHLHKPPQNVEGEHGVTTHTIARDQLATAQVHALLALNATLERLANLLSTEPDTAVSVHVEADPQAAREAAAEIINHQRRHQ